MSPAQPKVDRNHIAGALALQFSPFVTEEIESFGRNYIFVIEEFRYTLNLPLTLVLAFRADGSNGFEPTWRALREYLVACLGNARNNFVNISATALLSGFIAVFFALTTFIEMVSEL